MIATRILVYLRSASKFPQRDNQGGIQQAALIEILKRRIAQGLEDDARLNFYFTPADPPGAPNDFFGYRPAGATGLVTTGGVYDGSGSAVGHYSGFTFIDPNISPGDFRHPIITWAETQLIGAEAAFHAGGQAAAQPYLDAVRANRFYGTLDGARVQFPALGSAPASLVNIIEEKYISLFLNPEVWNDYKRTCLPALTPATGASQIPVRLVYPLSERTANPSISGPGPARNWNDPNPC